ncbi:MAG: mannose-6-phosphate isomerase [Erysipelotrichia bacterium]|nr:mannose-6-phosphate isomerase [Erysipelotrichia bacterium]
MLKKLNRIEPAYKDYLWGGKQLEKYYNKTDSGLDIIAESWELSTHPDGQSRIENENLLEYVKKHPEVLGTACAISDIPILIKYIDARQDLSIQVHPDDEYARRVEHDNGKTEMWYIIDAAPEACLYLGVNQKMSKEEFRKHIEDNTVCEVLNKVHVKAGECYLIRSGTIHAIAAGCMIIEIQERSNVTYRVYDFDRRDKNGSLRPLHIDKALEVANLEPVSIDSKADKLLHEDSSYKEELLKKTEYFEVHDFKVKNTAGFNVDSHSFCTAMLIRGNAVISCDSESLQLKQGESVFIPAGSGAVTVKGVCELITAEL